MIPAQFPVVFLWNNPIHHSRVDPQGWVRKELELTQALPPVFPVPEGGRDPVGVMQGSLSGFSFPSPSCARRAGVPDQGCWT